jgi:hypothetical protein
MSNLKDLKDLDKSARLLIKQFDGTIDSDGDFELRNTNRIDIAQVKAEEYLDKKEIPYKNIGFDSKEDRIPSTIWFKMPDFLRCMPDMFVYVKDTFHFLEIKGCRDSVKFKIDDLHQYNLWNGIAPVLMFIYSTKYDKNYLLNLELIWDNLHNGEWGRYNDNNKLYIDIPCDKLSN